MADILRNYSSSALNSLGRLDQPIPSHSTGESTDTHVIAEASHARQLTRWKRKNDVDRPLSTSAILNRERRSIEQKDEDGQQAGRH